jgi:hypothetical protein
MVVAAAWPTRWVRLFPAAVSGALLAVGGREMATLDGSVTMALFVVASAAVAASGIRAVRRCFDRPGEVCLLLAVLVVALLVVLPSRGRSEVLLICLAVAAAVELLRRDTLVAGTVGVFIAAALYVVVHDAEVGAELIGGTAVVAAIGPIGWAMRVSHPSSWRERWLLATPWMLAAVVAAGVSATADSNGAAVVWSVVCYVAVTPFVVWRVRHARQRLRAAMSAG